MATAYAQPPSALQSPRQQYLQPTPQSQRRHASRRKFAAEFSQCLYEFVIQLLPTPEELMVKEDVRKLLEQLIRTIEPDSRLLSFGSTANGFSLRNSDMDLCCLIDSEEKLAASDLVNMLGDLLERETKFHVKPLPHARIPIVKLSLDPAPGLPLGIACDIGFENRLALENTRLLMCYAMIDPARVRTMVLFLKVWSKRRKINSPYKGTLSSYGYVLLVIYFLVHVKNPPVLPNLQQMPPLRSISHEDTHLNGHNIWFFDDIELLRQRWKSSNTESVAELLIDFFKFYSRDFTYSNGVASIRAGLLSKDSKGWANEFDKGDPRERNRLCIEDPFETDYNVARCVTRDGLYTIRGEFMRASRILAACPDRAVVAISELCEERLDEELLHPSPPRGAFVPPRLSPLPPQIPYTIGSSPMRPISLPVADQLTASDSKTSANGTSPPSISSIPSSPPQPPSASSGCAEIQNPLPIDQLEHMAPKRSKWTSPPPPEAPEEDRSAFEQRLGQSLALATVASAARERERHTAPSVSSSAASEVPTDDEARSDIAESDDVHSLQSFNEEGTLSRRREKETEADREPTVTLERQQSRQMRPDSMYCVQDPSSSRQAVRQENALDAKTLAKLRGRAALKWPQTSDTNYKPQLVDKQATYVLPPRTDTPRTPRRSLSGPARTPLSNRFSQMAIPPFVPGPPYFTPDLSTSRQAPPHLSNVNVYYETTPSKDKMYRVLPYAFPMSPVSPVSLQQQYDVPTYYEIARSLNGSPSSSPRHTFAAPQQDMPSSRQPAPRHLPPSLRRNSRPIVQVGAGSSSLHVDDARLSLSPGGYSHSHSHSTATVTSATTPRAHVQDFGPAQLPSPSLSRSHSPPDLQREPQQGLKAQHLPPLLSGEYGARLPSSSASVSSESASPPMSSTSSQYAASCSPLSTSPPSPTHSDAFGKQQSRVHDSPRQSGRVPPQTTPAGRGTGDGHGMTVVTGQRGPTHARDVTTAQVGATRSHGNAR